MKTFEMSSRLAFVVLSYVWGSTGDEALIRLNGPSFHIGRNLYNALRQFQDCHLSRALGKYLDGTKTMWIWADAICINQNGVVENLSRSKGWTRFFPWPHLLFVGLVCLMEKTKRILNT
ncbi:hypothetical protein K458DRAFT_90270 [Lentithecium fluviatile CBS 122367]|uniref:Heterokaryon incompatibility domain-containing protein n=1 Tax=Lentithecium fluviatile CBS 122367 TaxID=1168545 RepID=A0A6G1IRN5_9PLEO|nr:hypothetical protein K458DRAFT_90270 [Lentithecium fluviatile CBS 122367]